MIDALKLGLTILMRISVRVFSSGEAPRWMLPPLNFLHPGRLMDKVDSKRTRIAMIERRLDEDSSREDKGRKQRAKGWRVMKVGWRAMSG